MRKHHRIVFVLILCFGIIPKLRAQINKEYYFKDSIDGHLDVSDWLINAKGFIPLPTLITEPALGGIGGGVFLIFIERRPPLIDTVDKKVQVQHSLPDITGVGGLYTANGTWLTGVFRQGTIIKHRIRYRVAAGYGNLNIELYRTLPIVGEKGFNFNFKIVPFFTYAMKQIAKSNWYGGLQYMMLFEETRAQTQSERLPTYLTEKEHKSFVSQPGVIVEYDVRDNMFSPNKGFKVHTDASISENWVGSDYSYQRINAYTYGYYDFHPRLIGGLRLDMQQAFGSPPFFMLPFIDMRGIPAARYQNSIDALTEGEIRWDFYKRWSVVGFGGTGKAFAQWNQFKDAEWVYSYGTGFRYLLARKFKLRMGIDVARGPEQWAYYIILGSAWLK